MAKTLDTAQIISKAIHRRPPVVVRERGYKLTGALEKHVTSYDKHAHGRVTAIDTRLSNGSIISKNKKKNTSFVCFYTAIYPHEDNMHVDCTLKTHFKTFK